MKDGIKKSEDHVEIIWKMFSVNAREPEVVQSWNFYKFKGNFSYENKSCTVEQMGGTGVNGLVQTLLRITFFLTIVSLPHILL